jgi:hypothetical protein
MWMPWVHSVYLESRMKCDLVQRRDDVRATDSYFVRRREWYWVRGRAKWRERHLVQRRK